MRAPLAACREPTGKLWQLVSEIYLYISGAPNQKIVYGNDKNMNWRCQMAAILDFTICGKTVPLTAWHTADVDSAEKNHIETINEVLFLKSAGLYLGLYFIYYLTTMGLALHRAGRKHSSDFDRVISRCRELKSIPDTEKSMISLYQKMISQVIILAILISANAVPRVIE